MLEHACLEVSLGDKVPREIPVVIEVPKNSKIKYEIDPETGLIRVERILYGSVHYPANSGFIPRTEGPGGGPLQILVLGQESFVPLSIVRACPLGGLRIKYPGEAEDKLIAVHADDPEYREFTSLQELPHHRIRELSRFFEDYKAVEYEDTRQVTVERRIGQEEAFQLIQKAIERYSALHQGRAA